MPVRRRTTIRRSGLLPVIVLSELSEPMSGLMTIVAVAVWTPWGIRRREILNRPLGGWRPHGPSPIVSEWAREQIIPTVTLSPLSRTEMVLATLYTVWLLLTNYNVKK